MVIGTRKTNSSVHPGAILQNPRKPRRSKKQMEEDKARKAALTAAAEVDTATKYQSTLARIAELQAIVENNEQDVRAHTLRPDLRVR